jgi:hypothetical protein
MKACALLAIKENDMQQAYSFANEYARHTCLPWDAVKAELGLS